MSNEGPIRSRVGGKLIFLSLVVMTMLPAMAYAQATITGTVRDTSGGILPGVTVEAASSALIEKVRTTVTGENGTYRIIDLRPGTYTVTFTLPGFNTLKREGLELAGDFVATLNMDMRVGGLEETITVTGESPIVDVQTAVAQRVMPKETMDAIPTGRTFQMLGFLIPGMTHTTTSQISGAQDVGGSRGSAEEKTIIHGSRNSDQMWYVSGLQNLSGITSSGGSGPNIPDMGAIQETVISYSGGMAEQLTGGTYFNLVPREGGNKISGSFHVNYGDEHTQSKNVDDDLRAQGLADPNRIKRLLDVNPSFGGPIKKDKLWFFFSARTMLQEVYGSGAYNNLNTPRPIFAYMGYPGQEKGHTQFNAATDAQLNTWTYAPDLSSVGFDPGRHQSYNTRLTLQATPRNKIMAFHEWQIRKNVQNISPLLSPDAASYLVHQPTQIQVNWSSPVTNRLLLEAGAKWVNRPWCQCVGTDVRLISVLEQSSGLRYRNAVNTVDQIKQDWGEMATVKYVTGTHDMKFGFQNNSAWQTRSNIAPPLEYRFNNGVPNLITQRTTPYQDQIESDWELGLYAQDRWTIGKLTLAYGARFDYQDLFYPEEKLNATPLAPNRSGTMPYFDQVSWKDITPRTSAAYDLFGNGRTAIKLSANKYIVRAFVGYPKEGPVTQLATSATRSWTDSNRNFVPDCDLGLPGAQNLTATGGDICGALSNQQFGTLLGESATDPDLFIGWGKRFYNWEFAGSVQQQLSDRMSLNIGYYRRLFGNFIATDNRAVTAADFSTFSVPIPTDARMPDSGGTLDDLVMVSAAKFGQVDNFVTLAKNYGKVTEHYNGVDVNVDARIRGGLTLQGGLSSGIVVLNQCGITKVLPEMGVTADKYCKDSQDLKHSTQIKFLGTYTIPKIDVLVSGTYQSIPGPSLAANVPVAASVVAASLGRPVPGNPANVTVQVIEPNTLFGEWLNQVDFRVGKVIRMGQARTRFSVDLYNALNANPIQAYNLSYGSRWLAPNQILTARLIKFSMQVDF